MSNIKDFRYEIIWEKERPTNIFFMKKQIGKVHENILVFYKHQPTYNPQMEKSIEPKNNVFKVIENNSKTHNKQKYHFTNGYDNSKRFPRSIQKINRDRFNALHPTQKPVALGRYLIRTYTNEGDLILDNTCGSGSFLVAAMLEKRKFIGIESDENYCKIARKRLEDTQKEIDSNLFLG
jgi:DNA modification methylase